MVATASWPDYRPVMNAKLFACLSYRDAPAPLEWMERVGFNVMNLGWSLKGAP